MTSQKVQLFNLLVRLIRIIVCFVYTDNKEKLIDVNFKGVKLRDDMKSFMQCSICNCLDLNLNLI